MAFLIFFPLVDSYCLVITKGGLVITEGIGCLSVGSWHGFGGSSFFQNMRWLFTFFPCMQLRTSLLIVKHTSLVISCVPLSWKTSMGHLVVLRKDKSIVALNEAWLYQSLVVFSWELNCRSQDGVVFQLCSLLKGLGKKHKSLCNLMVTYGV